jgi:ribosomal protein S18 acetylase RimI-like enzyme
MTDDARPSPLWGGVGGGASPSHAEHISIRPYALSDATACIGIFDRAWHAGHPYAPRVVDEKAFAAETTDETLFVAVDASDELIGFVSIYMPQSFVHHLYVDPSQGSRGIGTKLLAHALVAAGGSATLKCQTGNERALRFYRRLGWVEVAAGTGEFGPWVALRSPY